MELVRTSIDVKYDIESLMVHQQSIFKQLMYSFQKAEEEVVKSVLTKILKRHPISSDYRKVTRAFYDGSYNQYHLVFETVDLGIVKYNYGIDDTNTYGVSFTPSEIFT